jgi:hypothetical protein
MRILRLLSLLLAIITTTVLHAARSPFGGAPVSLPGTIQAENYDLGGEGVSWHDTTPGNVFGVYRSDDVDVGAIPSTSGGGYHIGNLANGEWTEYSINVAAAGTYQLNVRYATINTTANTFHIDVNGVNVSGTRSVGTTGGWHTFQVLPITVTLNAGTNQVLRVAYDTGAWNFDSISVAAVTAQTAFTPLSIPGRVQAENYDFGGPGVAFSDTTAGNALGAYRSDDVDVGADGSGGYYVGNVAAGEWTEYTVNVTAGKYTLRLRYASTATATFRVTLDGVDLTGAQSVTSTGSFTIYKYRALPVTVTAGSGKVLRVAFESGALNLDWLEIVPAITPVIPIRGVGINEGWASLAGFSLGKKTTDTANDIAARGFRAVKIWPTVQWPVDLAPIFANPAIKVIVYRPLHSAGAETCNNSSYPYAWEDVDYGALARTLYNRYGTSDKVVILTGWEGDNQIKYLPRGNPWCASTWPPQSVVDTFRGILDARQAGVRQAREENPDAKLRVYHAVEVDEVQLFEYCCGDANVLERVVPYLQEKPDFLSYSAWGSATNIESRLHTIQYISGMPADRIYVGEYGCRANNYDRANCFTDHATRAFNWGVRLWFVWAYSSGGGADGYDLIDGKTGAVTPNGFPVLQNIESAFRFTY